MKFKQNLLIVCSLGLAILGNYSCQQAGKNSTGSEFIPDMAHSTAYEANVLTKYSLNTWDDESVKSRRELSMPRLPVQGTIPRGTAGSVSFKGVFASAEAALASTNNTRANNNSIAYTGNGHVPYPYPDTEEGRNLATQQIRYNPYPITTNGLTRGKELYNVYCGICHGEKGDGSGYLVRDNGGKYPSQPANLVDSQFVFASNGRFYHAIVYGKNAMGSYAEKLSFEERWQVIHFIRSLQADTRKAVYSEQSNTLVAEYGIPGVNVKNTPPSTEKEPISEGATMGNETESPNSSSGGHSEKTGGH